VGKRKGDYSMEDNAFNDKSVVPDERTLLSTLGDMGEIWLELRRYVQSNYGPAIEEWKYYGSKSGWTMKLLSPGKNLFFFTALKGGFRLSFVFGDRAVEAILRSDLPKNIIDEVANAKKYPEGKGLRVEVKDRRAAAAVRELIRIKAEN
jgi:hypothetical protein